VPCENIEKLRELVKLGAPENGSNSSYPSAVAHIELAGMVLWRRLHRSELEYIKRPSSVSDSTLQKKHRMPIVDKY